MLTRSGSATLVTSEAHATAPGPSTTPAPTMAPTSGWVVETGRRVTVASSTHAVVPVRTDSAKAGVGCAVTMPVREQRRETVRHVERHERARQGGDHAPREGMAVAGDAGTAECCHALGVVVAPVGRGQQDRESQDSDGQRLVATRSM